MEYRNPNEFGHDIVYGFKQMAELDDFIVDIIPVDKEYQRGIPYCVFMLQNGYQGAFVLGFSLIDPWMHDFINTKTPTVLYDNFVPNNPNVSSIGCDSQEGFNLSVKHLVGLGHKKIG